MTDKAPNEMHVTQALAMIERLLASQRNYQACSVIKSACDYIMSLEKRVAELAPKPEPEATEIVEAAE